MPRCALAQKLHGHVGMFKVGKEVFTAEGPVVARRLVAGGKQGISRPQVPRYSQHGSRRRPAGGRLGVSLITIHASGGRKMIAAAGEGVRAAAKETGFGATYQVLAVTALTSLSAEDLAEMGFPGSPEEVVVRLARLAKSAGADGVVASPREITAIREACGPDFLIVTPGIRPATGSSDDQARTLHPKAPSAPEQTIW